MRAYETYKKEVKLKYEKVNLQERWGHLANQDSRAREQLEQKRKRVEVQISFFQNVFMMKGRIKNENTPI